MLEQQRVNAARPINPYDPQTGKLVDDYKPSFGQRFMRGVAGYAKGGVVGAINPAAVGAKAYGDPNKNYDNDLRMQQGRITGADQQLSNAAANYKATSERLAKIASERRALGAMGKDVTAASNQQQQIPIDKQKADADTARAYNDSPAGKAEAAKELSDETLTSRKAQITDPKNPVSKASRADQAYFIAQGKLPDPDRYHAPEEQIATAQAIHAFTTEHGHPPATLADYAAVRAAAKGTAPVASAGAPTGELSAGAKAIIEGREPMPSANSRAPGAQQLRAEVNAHDPTYDETKYPTYAKTRTAFTTGKEGIGLNSFNTALKHLDRLETNLPDNTSLPAANWAINLGRRASGSAALKPYEADALAVSNEVEKAYKGGALSEGDYNHMRALLNENDSPKAMKASIGELRSLLNGKLDSYQQQWESGMPKGAVSPLKTLRGGTSDGASGAFNWDDHPVVKSGAFNWDDHPVVM